jgi:hypothetical protein
VAVLAEGAADKDFFGWAVARKSRASFFASLIKGFSDFFFFEARQKLCLLY